MAQHDSSAPGISRSLLRLDAPDGGRFAVIRVGDPGGAQAPLVMLPGMFSSHRFWLSDNDVGLAAYLAGLGHCCYLVDRRGMGASASGDDGARSGLEEHVAQDLPVVAALVSAQNRLPAVWAGHSFGGVMASLVLANNPAIEASGLLLFATQYAVGKRALDFPMNLLTRGLTHLLGFAPARAVGLGPENESPAAISDACRWVATGKRQRWLDKALAQVKTPVLGIVGSGDRVDPAAGCQQFLDALGSPDKRLIIAGRHNGFAEDFDHPGIVVSRNAREQIWPMVGQWLRTPPLTDNS